MSPAVRPLPARPKTPAPLFTAAAARYKLRPVEVVDIPAPPAPRAPDLLNIGIINTHRRLRSGEALRG